MLSCCFYSPSIQHEKQLLLVHVISVANCSDLSDRDFLRQWREKVAIYMYLYSLRGHCKGEQNFMRGSIFFPGGTILA